MVKNGQLLLYIGSYAGKDEHGLYVTTLDRQTAQITLVESVCKIVNPSYLAIDPQRHHLYAVSETWEFEGQTGGGVYSFAIDPAQGTLTPINAQATLGADPCFLSVNQSGSLLLLNNYSGSSVATYPLNINGEIGAMAEFIQYSGKSLNPDRQTAPHPHSINLDPSGAYAFVCDLGRDIVSIYQVDNVTHKLTLKNEHKVLPGSGPRHLAFSANGSLVYIINELTSTIAVYTFDRARVSLQQQQIISTLPQEFHGTSTAADIHLAPSGKFLYASNRGDDSIAVYAVLADTGLLELVEHVPTEGKTPRNFVITPDGTFLLVANQDSNSIVTFALDPQSGRLKATGETFQLQHPVCLKIIDSLS
ncbi:lactonase family protein [Tengunoibacter tsumagoiensis]|uniref:6-phosphogluconolactonase n=1 Tax=Tengunoibacter tsumagoiensis TaxID=2014871 RepID=A0A402A197_9CHLR|nr:lactonase family protein [Tengunoibacter tsumagoiensis]GCE12884.1 hypothetical protein KTT_27430 [Tengunoibacter tsumagoiensis]